MPGLVGIASKEIFNDGLLGAMVQPMLHRPTYQIKTHLENLFGVTTVDLAQGRQSDIAVSKDGQKTLAVFGTMYERWAPRGTGLADHLLTRWQEQGARSLIDLNGEYLIAVWEKKERRLTIVNDRLGLKRLAMWHNETMFAFASEVKSLAVIPQVSRATDEQALAELLTFGHLQDDRTLLKDVKLLPPATVLVWEKGKISTQQYWQYVFKADPKLENTDRAIGEYAERVCTAVARRIEGQERIGLLLSGGLDSRTLAGMVRKVRPKGTLLTWTTGDPKSHDVRFARQIAEAVGSHHSSVEIPKSFLQEFGPHYAWVLDGMVTTHGAHRICVLPSVSEQTDVALIGFLGDTTPGGKPLDDVYYLSKLEELIETGYRRYAVGFDDSLFAQTLRPSVYGRIRGAAWDAFARSIREARVEYPADRVVWTELVQRQRLLRPLDQMDLMGIVCHVATPFADKEFIDFALRLPPHQRFLQKVYIGMIAKEFPRLARIPRAGEGLPLVHSRFRASLHWRWVLFERHTLPKLTGGRLGGYPYGDYAHCAQLFRSANRRFLEGTLIDNPVLESHFQMGGVKRLVEDFLNDASERDLMESIAALISFALFRERLDTVTPFGGQEGKEMDKVSAAGVAR